MAELAIKPLLSHRPEVTPPGRWSLYLLPVLVALVGIAIATAAAMWGQRDSFNSEVQRIARQRLALDVELQQERAKGVDADPKKLLDLEAAFRDVQTARPGWYRRPGNQFGNWDGYRYQEIIDDGYVCYVRSDPPEVRHDSGTRRAGWPERRIWNVVWYPLYPVLGFVVKQATGMRSTDALTVVSQLSLLAGTVVLFALARRHFHNRMPLESGLGADHLSRRWDLAPADTAALWSVTFLVFNPDGIFFCANYTESLFILLLGTFLWCIQGRHWWWAAVVAAVASSCRSQGVMFGPVLAVTFLLRSDARSWPVKVGLAGLFGMIASLGLVGYMAYLGVKFGDPLAFMHAQRGWNVGIRPDTVQYALNPVNPLANLFSYVMRPETDWPRLWEAFCVVFPPVVLMLLGARFLSFEQELMGWILWGLPYVSNSLAGSAVGRDDHWMSMGRFQAVNVALFLIVGAVLVRFRWLGPVMLAGSVAAFALFSYKFGVGNWIG